MSPASHQVSATPLKLMIQQIHPYVRVEHDSGMCVARGLYELWGRSPYTRISSASSAMPPAPPPGSTYTALRAVKGTEKGNESYVDLTQHCGKSPVTTNTVLHRV